MSNNKRTFILVFDDKAKIEKLIKQYKVNTDPDFTAELRESVTTIRVNADHKIYRRRISLYVLVATDRDKVPGQWLVAALSAYRVQDKTIDTIKKAYPVLKTGPNFNKNIAKTVANWFTSGKLSAYDGPLSLAFSQTAKAKKGSIDDPQSLAYDLANAPYGQPAIIVPYCGVYWYEVCLAHATLGNHRLTYDHIVKEEQRHRRAFAKDYAAKDMVFHTCPIDGVTEYEGFVISQAEHKKLSGSDRWLADSVTVNGQTEFRKSIVRRYQAAVAVELAELSADTVVGALTFAQWLLRDKYNLMGIVAQDARGYSVAFEHDGRVFFGIPENPAVGVNITASSLQPVNYSTVVQCSERDIIAGKVKGASKN